MTRSAPTDAGRPRVPPAFFDGLYADSEDPWDFAQSGYEREKYAHTLACLGRPRFHRVLEIGCSIGVFTGQLAGRCDELVGIDVSAAALDRARRRLAGEPGVRLARMSFPEAVPDGRWDLVVCAEVLYYLDEPGFARALGRLGTALAAGAAVLAVHWRPATRTYPLRGDEVHDRLVAELGRWHVLDDRRPEYRLDRFEGP